MNAIEIVDTLKESGLTDKQGRAIFKAIEKSNTATLATKQDLSTLQANLKEDIASVKADVAGLKSSVKALYWGLGIVAALNVAIIVKLFIA